jgi:tetratricopeptide (TPR) repeat protein
VNTANRPGLIAFGVGLLACAVYANTLGHGFAYDDPRVIVDNPAIRDWTDWRRIFTTPSWFLEGEATTAFRPLTTWTFAANRALHGTAPLGYHVVNVLLHAAVSALVVLVAHGIGTTGAVAALAGVLFAVHPIHTEVVANCVGRAELLAAALALLAFWLHRGAVRSPRGGTLDALAAGAYALGLLAKEHTIAMLVVLPLTDLVLDDARDLRRFLGKLRGRRAAFYGALLVATLASLALRAAVVDSVLGAHAVGGRLGIGYNVIVAAPLEARLLTALAVQCRALWLLVWPFRLSADYSYRQIALVSGLGDPAAVAGLLVAAGLAAGLAMAWRRSAVVFVWLALALCPWAIVSNLLVPIGTIFGERLLYLPSAGACGLFAMGIAWLARRTSWRPTGALVAALVVAWSLRTVTRNPVWASDLTLAEATVRDAPESAHAHDFLGRVYAGLGRDDEALGHLTAAATLLDAHPDWQERLDVLYETAMIHQRRGNLTAAEPRYREIVGRDPAYFPAWINLGALHNQRGEHRQALDAADRAVALRPEVPNAHLVRGFALRGLGRHAEALAAFEAALARAPGAGEVLLGIGASAIELGDFARAARAFEQLIATAPSLDAYRGLVMSLDGLDRTDEARRARASARARYPAEPAFREERPAR